MALADLADVGFVVLRGGSSLRDVTEDLCSRAGFTPRVEFECDDLATVHGFVAAGLGVATTPLPTGHREGLEDVAAVRFWPSPTCLQRWRSASPGLCSAVYYPQPKHSWHTSAAHGMIGDAVD